MMAFLPPISAITRLTPSCRGSVCAARAIKMAVSSAGTSAWRGPRSSPLLPRLIGEKVGGFGAAGITLGPGLPAFNPPPARKLKPPLAHFRPGQLDVLGSKLGFGA